MLQLVSEMCLGLIRYIWGGLDTCGGSLDASLGGLDEFQILFLLIYILKNGVVYP